MWLAWGEYKYIQGFGGGVVYGRMTLKWFSRSRTESYELVLSGLG
jgi:hypothetical protein